MGYTGRGACNKFKCCPGRCGMDDGNGTEFRYRHHVLLCAPVCKRKQRRIRQKAWQWDSDLIGYDALNSYGSPSYYVQQLFNHYLGNKIVPATFENVPVQYKPLSSEDSAKGVKAKAIPTLFMPQQGMTKQAPFI